MKEEEPKQPALEPDIERHTFFKEQFHAISSVFALWHGKAVALPAADKQHIVAVFGKGYTSAVNTLVGNQVIYYRNNGFLFQGLFQQLANNVVNANAFRFGLVVAHNAVPQYRLGNSVYIFNIW